MKTMTAEKEFVRIQKHAEKIRNDEGHKIETASSGDMWAQGDVQFVYLDSIPKGCKPDAKPSRQLAPGTSQGSRHCLTDMTAVRLHRIADPTPLDGPVIEAPCGC